MCPFSFVRRSEQDAALGKEKEHVVQEEENKRKIQISHLTRLRFIGEHRGLREQKEMQPRINTNWHEEFFCRRGRRDIS